MADTQRTQAELLALAADNNSGQISAQDLRDIIVSAKLRDMADDNILVNQDFSVWQENTTFTNPAAAVYTADGYYVTKADAGGTAPSVNVKRNAANMETGFAQCCELEITNVGVQDAGAYWELDQTVEDFENYRGKTVTFSIRVKASTAITTTGYLQVFDGVGNTNASVDSIGTDWTTATVTHAVNSSASELTCRYFLVYGGILSTTGSVYVQYMKLELGSVATDLIPRSTGDDLRLCQRYYQKSYAYGIFATSVNQAGQEIIYMNALSNGDHTIYKNVTLPVPMKAAPTITLYDNGGNSGQVTMAAGNVAGAASNIAEGGFMVNGTNGAASTIRQLQFHWIATSRA